MKQTRAFKAPLAAAVSAALMATLLPLAPATAATEVTARTEVNAQAVTVDSAVQIAAKKIQRDPSKIDVFVNKSYPLSPKKYAPKP